MPAAWACRGWSCPPRPMPWASISGSASTSAPRSTSTQASPTGTCACTSPPHNRNLARLGADPDIESPAMKALTLLIWLPLLILTNALAYAAPRTEIIPLDYGTAEDLLPAMQTLLHPDERASAYGNQLIIRAEPERLQEIRTLLSDLDRRPTRLRISVANAGTGAASEQGYQIDGRITIGRAHV